MTMVDIVAYHPDSHIIFSQLLSVGSWQYTAASLSKFAFSWNVIFLMSQTLPVFKLGSLGLVRTDDVPT